MFNFPRRGVWSTNAASTWEEGYFVGDGESGGILFGEALSFQLAANQHDLFLKKNKKTVIPDLAENLNELRMIIEEKGYQKGIEYFEKEAEKEGYEGLTMSDPYQPGCELLFSLKGKEDSRIKEYFRKLDYEKGLVSVNFSTQNGQIFNKQLFCSKKEKGLFFEINSNEHFDLAVSFKSYIQQGLLQEYKQISEDSVVQKTIYLDGSFYETYLSWSNDEGNVQIKEDKLIFENCRKVQLNLLINPTGRINKVRSFEEILTQHISQFNSVYSSVKLNLVDEKEREKELDNIIQEMDTDGEIPIVLYEKLYDASRYFIQSMSGKALPNLQGIWAGDFSPAWSGDYTFDTNVQLSIASLSSLGLFDHFEGLFRKMSQYDKDFKENAQRYYGCRGYLMPAHASTHALHIHWNSEWPLIFWTAGAGWIAYFYNEYYEYTLDKTFLMEKAIPFYIETLLFYEDFLTVEKDQVLIRPSYSAENGMGDNSTMDVAVIKATIGYLKNAYEQLGKTLPEKYEKLIQSLPEYMIDSEGVLKEWIDTKTVENPNHRHFSNLYPVFQTKEITSETPILWKAAGKAFDKRIEAWLLSDDGDTSSSHGRIHAAMCALSLERPRILEASLEALVSNHSFFPSLATSHYNNGEVFNVDANGSLPKIVHDSLIYVEKFGEVTLLKAVPSWLAKGSLAGIHLPDGITINQFTWDLKQGLIDLEVTASHATTLVVNLQKQYKWENSEANNITIELKEMVPAKRKIKFTVLGAGGIE